MYITPKNNNVSIYCFSSEYFVLAFGWHMPAEAKKKKKKKGKWNWTALWEFNIERKQLEKEVNEEYSRWVYTFRSFCFIQEKIKYGGTAPGGDRENVKRKEEMSDLFTKEREM